MAVVIKRIMTMQLKVRMPIIDMYLVSRPQQNGVYSIVTVNSQGEPVVVDPAYGK